MEIGVQLYTLRKYGKNTSDLAVMLPRVREMGYSVVQYSGCALFPSEIPTEELKKLMDDNGLTVTLTHVQADRIFNDTQRLCEEHLSLGCPTIGLGSMPGEARNNPDELKKFIEKMNKASEIIVQNGLRLAYHNHDGEFKKCGNEMIFETLLRDFAPDILFTMDTYWVRFAGYDPIEWIKKLSGRIKDLHIKDWTDQMNFIEKIFLRQKGKMCPVGAGKLDFKAIFAVAKESGVQNALIELDNAKKPYEALQQSTDYLNKLFPDKSVL